MCRTSQQVPVKFTVHRILYYAGYFTCTSVWFEGAPCNTGTATKPGKFGIERKLVVHSTTKMVGLVANPRLRTVAVLAFLCFSVEAFHFRGGTVSWRFKSYEAGNNGRAIVSKTYKDQMEREGRVGLGRKGRRGGGKGIETWMRCLLGMRPPGHRRLCSCT